jgi:hypothetical protein
LAVASASASALSGVMPTLSTVSIMPGMEAAAPERTLTSSGSDRSPNRLCISRSTAAIA